MVDRGSHEYAGHEPPDFATCRVIETHISRLFFSPDRVYKMLKPIRTGFLDHTDPPRRIAAIDAELVLNRRLRPRCVLGSADLWEGDELVDRLIIMKRLPDDRRLSALATRAGIPRTPAGHRPCGGDLPCRPAPRDRPRPALHGGRALGFWTSSFDDMRPLVGRCSSPRSSTPSSVLRWLSRPSHHDVRAPAVSRIRAGRSWRLDRRRHLHAGRWPTHPRLPRVR